MPDVTADTSPRTYARAVGILYLAIFVLGPFAFFMGRTSVRAQGDPAATLERLMASESIFRLGMVAETLIILSEIVVSALLYVLLRPVSRPLSLAAALARFAQAILQAANLFTAVPALLLLGGTGYLAAFEPDRLHALVQLSMDVNAFMILMWGLLFGFHLALLGYLVYRSQSWPKILGGLLMVAALGYLLQSYGHLLAPRFDGVLETIVVVLSIPGELAFTVWLLWKGLDVDLWKRRASGSAGFGIGNP